MARRFFRPSANVCSPSDMRSADDITRVQIHVAQGQSDYEIARRTGIPRSTVQRWRSAGPPTRGLETGVGRCESCGQPTHRSEDLPGGPYAYLLGQYLGDGTIYRTGRDAKGRTLRISSDAIYPALMSSWKGWPCLFPQRGPGRKHSRDIVLVDWQSRIVDAYPGPFLRGLIHSDGWRGLNKVHVKGRDYAYPRYQFSNRSDDIRQLFTYACDLVGIAWRPWGRYHISVARMDAVALLDEFVGPKQ